MGIIAGLELRIGFRKVIDQGRVLPPFTFDAISKTRFAHIDGGKLTLRLERKLSNDRGSGGC